MHACLPTLWAWARAKACRDTGGALRWMDSWVWFKGIWMEWVMGFGLVWFGALRAVVEFVLCCGVLWVGRAGGGGRICMVCWSGVELR